MLPNHYKTSSSKIGNFYPTDGSYILPDPPSGMFLSMGVGMPPMGTQAAPQRYNELLASDPNATFKLCVVEFNVPGAKNGGSDKGPNGHRIDSIPIANGVIKAGGACDIVKYFYDKHNEFAAATAGYDALIVRINPGQLSQGTAPGTQERFDALMNSYIAQGKLVWSSPKVQTQMGAKDALVKIAHLNCGLKDTLAYYSPAELALGFKQTCAFQPRVIKQNRGSAGEGIWLCWRACFGRNSGPTSADSSRPAFESPRCSLGHGEELPG